MRDSDRTVVFDCAVALASIIAEQSDAFIEMCDYIDERVSIAKRIASYESNADDAFHDLGFYYLENKLISDSEALAVFDIVLALENITDSFEELANSLVRYNISESGSSLSDCATALYGVSQNTQELIIAIRDRAPTGLIIRDINSIDRFKSKYCKFYDEAILELFTECTDAIDIIRSRAIYDSFKTIFESFETMSERCYKYILFRD